MAKRYKGGHATLNSGGIRPDDFMFRVLPNGRYYLVIIQSKEDLAALSTILKNCERVHWHELGRRRQDERYADKLTAAEFLDRYPLEK